MARRKLLQRVTYKAKLLDTPDVIERLRTAKFVNGGDPIGVELLAAGTYEIEGREVHFVEVRVLARPD